MSENKISENCGECPVGILVISRIDRSSVTSSLLLLYFVFRVVFPKNVWYSKNVLKLDFHCMVKAAKKRGSTICILLRSAIRKTWVASAG